MNVPFQEDFIEFQDCRKIIVFSENGRTYKAMNEEGKECCALRIDGGVFGDSVQKCDKGLVVCDGRFFLIELKGVDVNEACKQLLSALEQLRAMRCGGYDYFCRAVVTKMPPKKSAPRLLGASYRKLQTALGATSANKKLVYKSVTLEESI